MSALVLDGAASGKDRRCCERQLTCQRKGGQRDTAETPRTLGDDLLASVAQAAQEALPHLAVMAPFPPPPALQRLPLPQIYLARTLGFSFWGPSAPRRPRSHRPAALPVGCLDDVDVTVGNRRRFWVARGLRSILGRKLQSRVCKDQHSRANSVHTERAARLSTDAKIETAAFIATSRAQLDGRGAASEKTAPLRNGRRDATRHADRQL
jgi:hypothetical protein